MSFKAGNFSFQARTAQNWLWIGKCGTNLEPHRSHEAPCTAQPSVHPLGAVFGFGFGGTLAHECITPYSKDYSLASNLQAKQHGVAFQ